jgi:hypothetical protein
MAILIINIKIMYFPFLQNDFNSYCYYSLPTLDPQLQAAPKPIQCLQ